MSDKTISSDCTEVELKSRNGQIIGIVAAVLSVVLGLGLAYVSATQRIWWATFSTFIPFWGGIILLVFLVPVAKQRDRVGLRLNIEGIDIRNSALGRTLGQIPWSRVSTVTEQRHGFVLSVRNAQELSLTVPSQMRTLVINGIIANRRFLDISHSSFTDLLNQYFTKYIQPDVSEKIRTSSENSQLTSAKPFQPDIIRPVLSRCLQPFGIASKYLYILLSMLVIIVVAQILIAILDPNSLGVQPVFWVVLMAAILVALVVPGYGLFVLRKRYVRVSLSGIDEISLFGSLRHHKLVGLSRVTLHEGLASFGEPTVSIELVYQKESKKRRAVISGKGMPSTEMRALGSWIKAQST